MSALPMQRMAQNEHEWVMATGQLMAAATCPEVPVKSRVISSPLTFTVTAILIGWGFSPKPSM